MRKEAKVLLWLAGFSLSSTSPLYSRPSVPPAPRPQDSLAAAQSFSAVCKRLQKDCMRQSLEERRWFPTRASIEACAMRRRPDCRRYPINNLSFELPRDIIPPVEALPNENGLIPGSIDLHFSCKREREACQLIYFYDYRNRDKKVVIWRLTDSGGAQSAPPFPLTPEEEASSQAREEEANRCYHPWMITDYGYLPREENRLMQIPLYGSPEGCYLPDQNGCYQNMFSESATGWRSCPADLLVELESADELWRVPCLLKFDTYQFGVSLPRGSQFCFIHFLVPQRVR